MPYANTDAEKAAVETAMTEALRFLAAAEDYSQSPCGELVPNKIRAAMMRASLDLSQRLVDLRRPG